MESDKMIQYIIEGKRWFDKVSGNTYHTISITDADTNTLIYNSETTYGYGDQYRQTAIDWLIKQNILDEQDRFNHNIIRNMIYFNVSDVIRKRDM